MNRFRTSAPKATAAVAAGRRGASPASVPIDVLVARIAVGLVVHAHEAACAGSVPSPVPRDLWKGAQRPLELDAARRAVIDVMRGDDLLRRNAVLYPLVERHQKVVVSVHYRSIRAVAEGIRAVSAPAMRHPGNHEQTVELLNPAIGAAAVFIIPGPAAAQNLPDFLVVVDAVHRRDGRIGPADVMDHLAAMRTERAQIRIDRIHDPADAVVRKRQIGGEVESPEIEVRILEDEIGVKPVAEKLLERLARRERAGQIAGS